MGAREGWLSRAWDQKDTQLQGSGRRQDEDDHSVDSHKEDAASDGALILLGASDFRCFPPHRYYNTK